VTHHVALLQGIASFLDSEGLAVYTADGVYTADQHGVVFGSFPATPNEIVSVSLYLPEYVGLGTQRRLVASSVQVKYRLTGGNLRGIEYFDKLLARIDRRRLQLGDIRANGAYLSWSPLGQDSNDRWVFTSNWRFTGVEAAPATT
jgi:hypothetical protein